MAFGFSIPCSPIPIPCLLRLRFLSAHIPGKHLLYNAFHVGEEEVVRGLLHGDFCSRVAQR